ncbi:signal peptidase LepB [Thermoclostridium stercorarium subsp. stercorarium DSM 8532]|uniref:Signal peptidase I n=3 Tax=Thermoclostridium stercorarium TaxID=1510 RepID=L7VRM9_THES1|nr:signal peptidase I [Thermoclostridium stercorarium]AGC68213.1 signal peptidase LepB [Thermoclostridium stercorarium subsp. stercorarium DSM 8532]AGI39243.1 signal peptidase-1 [Thermoclostridium stercorarium subsp. stercorarium DSM 8532]ANW98582.1 signal peptidase LepB [Thermoclostridium stercorarium subsp. thermolacticum DSM 2910]ANX01120.1 signal peptidase LepB [Thermoclostridium stercorarium subsp. leptospartum DSM 9219]UZQ86740.1 signal peptidase I [Thermoclostridium stercorarium]
MNEEQKTNKTNIGKEILEWILYFIGAVIVASLLQSQFFALTTVHQSSMQNTLQEGHTLIINKLSYQFSKPQRGDIVVFLRGENTSGFVNKYKVFLQDVKLRFRKSFRTNRLIKRIIAVEGDEIDIHDGKVYINGELLEEPYVKGITPEMGMEYPLTVPEGYVFVMGDNRENSLDSRTFGPIPVTSIEGKAIFRVFPFSEIGKP